MRFLKLVSALIIAALAIGALILLAIRYMDIMMKPYNALVKLIDKVSKRYSSENGSFDGCCCSSEDVEG